MQVNITGNIKENMANLVYEFIFTNNTQDVLNPTHYFSLDENSTITNLTLQISDRILNSQIKELKKAQTLYDNAKIEGRLSTIFETISKTEYKLSFCNLLPQETSIIKINFNSYLEIDTEGFYKFFIPTNIALKYQNTEITYTSKDILSYNFDIIWSSVNNIQEIIGEYFPIDYKTIRVLGNSLPRNGDYIIRVKTSNIPSLYYYKKNNNIYAIANIKVKTTESSSSGKNYSFILDCSGSMSEKFKDTTKIESAKIALIRFLNSLKPDDYFNVILFGSSYRCLFVNSVIASQENINIALRMDIRADMGGTELFSCLTYSIFSENLSSNVPLELEKIIIIITDGQISNKKELFESVKDYHNLFSEIKNAYQERINFFPFRIFTIGIGNSVDRNLIKELSVITNGDFFCASDNDRFLYNVDMIMTNTRSIFYKNPKICYSNSSGNYYWTESVNNYHVLYPNKTYMFCLNMYRKCLEDNNFYIECQNSKTDKIINCKINKQNMIESDVSIKHFYYNEMINKYENKLYYDQLSRDEIQQINSKIIELSIEGGIMSNKTAFLTEDEISRTDEISIDYVVPNYHNSGNIPACEEVDALEGGMNMFGSSTVNTDVIFNENPTFSHLCYENELHALNQMKETDIKNIQIFYKIIMYMKFRKNGNLLCSILREDIIFPYTFLQIQSLYKEYIESLKNSSDYYIGHFGGGDY